MSDEVRVLSKALSSERVRIMIIGMFPDMNFIQSLCSSWLSFFACFVAKIIDRLINTLPSQLRKYKPSTVQIYHEKLQNLT